MKSKKFLSWLLVLAMVLSLMPAMSQTAFAGSIDTPLTFTAEEANAKLSFRWRNGSNVRIKASSAAVTVGGTAASTNWQDYTWDAEIVLPSVGDSVSFKGLNVTTGYDSYFTINDGKIAASGDVTSLTNGVGGDADLTEECCYQMFQGCTTLTKAPALPATTLADYCYMSMFYGCTALTEAPELPAKELAYGCYQYMFQGCTALTEAPELPATTLASSCYGSMFQGCTSLTEAPELPSTALASSCYHSMFKGCTALTEAPELKATTMAKESCKYMFQGCTALTQVPALPAATLAESCCQWMFEGCTALTEAPELPSTALTSSCYHSMFKGCTALTEAPELKATTLASSCYAQMFDGCTSLTEAPKLPATELVVSCYAWMFKGCTALTEAPELPATKLENFCYQKMFDGCTALTEAPALPATAMEKYCYNDMFNGCTALTKAPELKATTLANNCYQSMFSGCTGLKIGTDETEEEWKIPATQTEATDWNKDMFKGCTGVDFGDGSKQPALNTTYYQTLPTTTPFTLTAQDDSVTISLAKTPTGSAYQYSADDGETWTDFTAGVTVNDGESIQICMDPSVKAADVTYGMASYLQFKTEEEGTLTASGDVMSLLAADTASLPNYAFYRLFYRVTNLTDASELVLTTTTAENCCREMFGDCSGLTEAPELPAETMENSCYYSMFYGCTALTAAPELPATTLAESCYNSMFYGCSGLTEAPEHPATELAETCYNKMFQNCKALTEAPELPATTLAKDCYTGMFRDCTGLTAVPELPATTLADFCYATMFYGCTALKIGTTETQNEWKIPATEKASSWNYNMFANCPDVDFGDGSKVPALNTTYYQTLPTADPLTLTAQGDSVTISLNSNFVNLPTNAAYQYSVDDGASWAAFTSAVTVNDGESIQICMDPSVKAADVTYSPARKFIQFKTEGEGTLTASGDVMSLLAADTENLPDYVFYKLFSGVANLTDASELKLPATTLAEACYSYMFNGCTGLTAAPELPATTLAKNCYNLMFQGCTALTAAPELPATELEDQCYDTMFRGCTGLTEAPELPATELEDQCYDTMFRGCTGLTEAPELPATTLAKSCYRYMFQSCTGLTAAPELPATELAESCYQGMFNGCTGLKIGTAETENEWTIPATTAADDWNTNMFYRCPDVDFGEGSKEPALNTTYYTVGSHEHEFTYAVPDAAKNTVVATCGAEDCDLDGGKVTLTLTAAGGTYNGNEYKASTDDATVKFTETTGATVGSIEYYKGTDKRSGAPTNVGSYTAKVSVSDGTNTYTATKDFTITKAAQSATVSVANYTYGDATLPTPTASGVKDSAAVTYYYNTTNSASGGTAWTSLTSTTLEPGTYYLYGVLAATDNYESYTTATAAFTVSGENFTGSEVTVSGYTGTYDGQPHSITVTAPEGATVTYSTDGTSYSATNPTATDVGTTTVYYKVSKTGYNDKTGNADIVITKATATSAMTTPENNPFSLKAKKDATVEITLPALPDDGASYGTVNNSNTSLFTVGAISGGKVTVTSAKDWDEATDGGNKTFTVKVTGAKNYNDYDIEVTITPVFKTALTVSGVSMENTPYTYGDTVGYTGIVSMKNGEDAVTGITPEYTYYQTSDKGTTWTKLNAAPTDAGDYKLVVSIPESNDDYEGSQEIPFSIAKKSVTAPSANTNTFTYTGSEQSYMTIAETADYKLTSDSAAASQTNAGTYTIKLELKDTANCQWAEGTVTEFTFVINPRVTIKDQTGAVVCNGVDTKLDGSYKLPEGTTLKPGTYQVVTELGSKTITTILVVEDGTEPTTTVTIPTKDVSSEVEIKTTEGTPKITVGGLDNLANTYTPSTGESITVTMTVEAKPADPSSEAQTAIKAVNDAQTTKVSKFDFVDMSIIKESFINGTSNGTNDIHDAQGVLEIIVPFTTSGRKDITVFRYHNDGVNTPETKAFEKLDTRPTTGFADGKFFVGDGFIVVYAQYFSEYAIGYEEEQDDPYIPYIPVTPSYTITGANTENGKLTISRKTASAGQTVTITVTPEEGYKLDALTVKDAKGNVLTLTKINDTTYTYKMPSGKVTVSATFAKIVTACPQDETCVYAKFTDADTKAWYHDGVHFCVENGYMQGVSATAFDPAGTTTRAMIVTILWRLEGKPVVNYAISFKDVKANEWYTEAIRWAQSTGIVEGYSAEAFGPDDPITREQMATILYRYAKYHSIDVKNTNTLAGFTDVNKVSTWALDAMKWANAAGLVQGRTTTTLVPEVSITRAEAACMVQRYCEKVCED